MANTNHLNHCQDCVKFWDEIDPILRRDGEWGWFINKSEITKQIEERGGLKHYQLPLSRGAVAQHFEEIQLRYFMDLF